MCIWQLTKGQVPSTNLSARNLSSPGDQSCWTSFSQSISFASKSFEKFKIILGGLRPMNVVSLRLPKVNYSLKISWTISSCLAVDVRPKWSVEMLNHLYTSSWMALYLSHISWQERPSWYAFVSVAVPYSSVPQM